MRKLKIFMPIAAVVLLTGSIKAQEKLSSDSTQLFFDDKGAMTHIRVTSEDVQNKVIIENPRKDDVAWQRVVLRVIDLRELQNRPLYYPSDDIYPYTQKNLFSIIFSNVLEGKLTPYKSELNNDQTFVPPFTPENQWDVQGFLDASELRYNAESTWDKVNYVSAGIIKYYVQVVYYFDKSTSRLRSKIIAIAPLFDENYYTRMAEIHTGVWFWVSYDELRPFLQEEFIKMNGRNSISQMDFDQFLLGNFYSSYIIKDYDLTSRDIDKYPNGELIEDPRFIRQEQDRIENEILDFEQDLWAY